MLPALNNKHIDGYLAQKSPGEKVEPHGDMESLRTYLI
jgi:hypothetical protein